jgi:hypothetical protein
VAQALQYLFLPETHDLTEPNAGVDGYKERALSKPGWLSVLHNFGIDRCIPDFDDLSIRPTALEAKVSQHFGEAFTCLFRTEFTRNFQGPKVHATPLVQHPGTGTLLARPQGRGPLQKWS